MFDSLIIGVKTKFVNNFSRRIFNKYRSCAQTDNEYLNGIGGMFPRVYKTNKYTNIELSLISSNGFVELVEPEYLYGVVDKFLRVTDPDIDYEHRFSVRIIQINKKYLLYKYNCFYFYRDAMNERR